MSAFLFSTRRWFRLTATFAHHLHTLNYLLHIPHRFVVKAWAKSFRINDSSMCSFSSYALILMVLSFLQKQSPPVLPYLQQVVRSSLFFLSKAKQKIFSRAKSCANFYILFLPPSLPHKQTRAHTHTHTLSLSPSLSILLD